MITSPWRVVTSRRRREGRNRREMPRSCGMRERRQVGRRIRRASVAFIRTEVEFSLQDIPWMNGRPSVPPAIPKEEPN